MSFFLQIWPISLHQANSPGTIWDWWNCGERRGAKGRALQDCHNYRVGRGCKFMQEFNHLPLCTDCLMNTCSFRSGMRRPLATRQHSGTEVRSVLLKLFSILNWLVFDVCWLQVQEQPVTSRKRWEHSIHSIKHRNIFHCYNTEISITV